MIKDVKEAIRTRITQQSRDCYPFQFATAYAFFTRSSWNRNYEEALKYTDVALGATRWGRAFGRSISFRTRECFHQTSADDGINAAG